jgi:hypothetical protein
MQDTGIYPDTDTLDDKNNGPYYLQKNSTSSGSSSFRVEMG